MYFENLIFGGDYQYGFNVFNYWFGSWPRRWCHIDTDLELEAARSLGWNLLGTAEIRSRACLNCYTQRGMSVGALRALITE